MCCGGREGCVGVSLNSDGGLRGDGSGGANGTERRRRRMLHRGRETCTSRVILCCMQFSAQPAVSSQVALREETRYCPGSAYVWVPSPEGQTFGYFEIGLAARPFWSRCPRETLAEGRVTSHGGRQSPTIHWNPWRWWRVVDSEHPNLTLAHLRDAGGRGLREYRSMHCTVGFTVLRVSG